MSGPGGEREDTASGRHRVRGQLTHLAPDVLAEFRAGVITGRRGTRVAAHLAGCDRCAALGDQLAEVSALLAAVPAPTMPDRVAQRLELVLAAETARRDDSERAGASGSRDRAADARPARHRGWRLVVLRVLAPAAAVVVLAAGGYGLSRIIGSGQGQTASSSGVAAAPAPTATSANGALSRPAAGPAIKRGFSVVTSSTDYQPSILRLQLERALRTPATSPARPPSPQLRACVSRLTAGVRPGVPVLVESARYQGQPATVVVASSGDGYMAWVMTPDCSAKLASTAL